MSCRYCKPEHKKMCDLCVCRDCPRANEDDCRLFWMGVADECDRDRPNANLKCIEEWTHYTESPKDRNVVKIISK